MIKDLVSFCFNMIESERLKKMNLKSLAPTNLMYKTKLVIEKLRGLDFMTIVKPEDVGLDPRQVYHSSPSGNQYLHKLLNELKITAKDSIVDIGCGKGSAMYTMLDFPFLHVDGIELSEKIATIAKNNFRRLRADRVTLFNCDASLFSNYDAYNMVYMYNPFPCAVMAKVIDNIIKSICRIERELLIIYNNATCHDMVVDQGFFTKVSLYEAEYGSGISIYSNRTGKESRLSEI